ncbi:NADPH-dependent quinone reductase ArsH [Galdieria sulphuraria]|nr:NADPH-dependent quinone reductase ArsH [Galdieria sulphuraria]
MEKLSEWKKFRIDSDKNDWIEQVDISGAKSLYEKEAQDKPLRVLVLYGSLRQRSFSRCCAYEAARLLDHLGADVRVFDPTELPVKGQVEETHHKVQELRELALWSEAQFWCSPEILGSVRPTQGRTLAICQVNGGSQSFNAVNTLRVLGRWMQFDEYNRMKPSPLRDRLVDVVEELVKFSLMLRDHSSFHCVCQKL